MSHGLLILDVYKLPKGLQVTAGALRSWRYSGNISPALV